MRRLFTTAVAAAVFMGLLSAPLNAKPAKRAPAAWLGVYSQSVDKDIADAFELDIEYGAIINEVIDDSPADEAGIEDGDVIISFEGNKVWDQDDLLDFIEENEVSKTVSIELIRDGKKMTVNATLGKRPRSGRVLSGLNRGKLRNHFRFGPGHGRAQVFGFHRGGYIGVSLSELSEQLADYFGVKNGEGVLITEVSKDSPAEKAGLKAGDVIVSIGDEEVSDYSDVKEIVTESDEGDKLTFTIIRSKHRQNIEVEVAESDENSFGYGFFSGPDMAIIPDLPAMPDIDIHVPNLSKRHFRLNSNDKGYFDYDEFLEDMSELREDMAEFKEEMKELNWKFKRLEKEDRRELKAELDKLRKQLKELENKLD